MTFHGGIYVGGLVVRANTFAVVPPGHRHRIGIGVIPACNDTNQSHSHDQKMAVYAIDGFGSSTLLADPGGQVWQRALPSNPVVPTHQAVVGGHQLLREPWVGSTHTPNLR
ncbi:hypothetical protein GHK86_07180 [Acidimicrobiaceae bacterium USS-CC1]|uniref:Uncharacterized protein n=1 Tax=Acidiferrimicrobium australe TaxID=2664430 RepID=A0ABW9QSM7_9ACTN|nr:hypothetical protein [Acidiferrimicrobium australe]